MNYDVYNMLILLLTRDKYVFDLSHWYPMQRSVWSHLRSWINLLTLEYLEYNAARRCFNELFVKNVIQIVRGGCLTLLGPQNIYGRLESSTSKLKILNTLQNLMNNGLKLTRYLRMG